jgi:hypothetical protein
MKFIHLGLGMKRAFLAAWIAIFLVGCSGISKKENQELRDSFLSKNYAKGHEILKKQSPEADPKSKLLFLMHEGELYHAEGNYLLSSQYFEKAIDTIRELYTVRISKKIASTLISDSSDVYYGPSFEHSLVYYYNCLNYVLLAQNEKKPDQRKQFLSQARATVLAWDGLLSTFQDTKQGESAFKYDLVAKILGGTVHEMMGSRDDTQIALQLYKDALTVLLRQYNAYPSMNAKFGDFKKHFSELPNLSVEKILESYVSATGYQKDVKTYLLEKIYLLTKKNWPQDLSGVVRDFQIPADLATRMNASAAGNGGQVTVILSLGIIPEKEARKVNIGLEGIVSQIKDPAQQQAVRRVGLEVLMGFASGVLGLTPDPGTSAGMQAAGIAGVGFALASASIEFELPEVNIETITEKTTLEIYRKTGEKMKSIELNLVQPLSEIEQEAIRENAVAQYTKTGVRLGIKHLSAIIAAYGTYKALHDRLGPYLAKSGAIISYAGLSKGIAMTEKIDRRQWATLPREIRLTSLELPFGEYDLKAKIQKGDRSEEVALGTVKVEPQLKNSVVSYRLNYL